MFKEITLGWGQLDACSVSEEQIGTSEIKLGGGVGVMHWPKSLPEMVLEETIAASECCRRDESYDRYLRIDDYYRRKDDSYYDRYKEPEGE